MCSRRTREQVGSTCSGFASRPAGLGHRIRLYVSTPAGEASRAVLSEIGQLSRPMYPSFGRHTKLYMGPGSGIGLPFLQLVIYQRLALRYIQVLE